MKHTELTRFRGELEDYVAEVFAPLVRKDQRATAGLYLQGLMLEGRRKSMQPMATRLGIDHQRLQQFVSSSSWPVEPVRKLLAHKAVGLIDPVAWVVDDTGFVKDGHASPGVARQYSGTVGKVGNVQIGVSVHAVTDQASCPLDWRLFLPTSWDDTQAESEEQATAIRRRRTRAQTPDHVFHGALTDSYRYTTLTDATSFTSCQTGTERFDLISFAARTHYIHPANPPTPGTRNTASKRRSSQRRACLPSLQLTLPCITK